jgi:membrane-associated phospholipid phosphatase
MRALGSAAVVVGVALVVAAALWRARRRPDLAAVCIAAPLLAGVAEAAVRSQIDRPLPLSAKLEGAFGYGFPSGHTAGVVALCAAMVVAVFELSDDRRVRTCGTASAASLVVAVASSSVIGGAHRSLDVVGGLLLGAAAALAATTTVRVAISRR